MTAAPTMAEVARVRRWECSRYGHDWSFIRQWTHELPVAIVCDRCGRTAKVVAQ